MAGATAHSGLRSSADRYLAGVGAVAVVVLAVSVAVAAGGLLATDAVLLVAALALCAPAPLLTHWRADSIALTVDELFVVPAFVLLPAPAVVAVVAVGTGIGLTLGPWWSGGRVRHRYFATRRTVFNVSQKTLSAGAGALVVSVVPASDAPDAATIAAAVLGAVAYAAASRLLVAQMIAYVRGRRFREVVSDDTSSFLVVSLVLLSIGGMLALATITLPAPALWVALVVGLVLAGSSLTNRVARQQERLSALLVAAAEISEAGPDVGQVEDVIERSAARLLDCSEARLELRPPAEGEVGVEVAPGTWLHVAGPLDTSYRTFDEDDRSLLEALAAVARPALAQVRGLAQLRIADELKAAVLASVSHDLRTPLATASGIADFLAVDEDVAVEERRELLARLRSSVGRVARLVDGLLDLERYELGRLPEPADAEVGAVIAAVVEAVASGATSSVEVEGTPVRARIDAPALERVIENLLSNALKHTPAGEPVHIRHGVRYGAVDITVDDAGPGVPEERRETIFEPFQHGDRPGAVGLGLWVARRFVELRGGRIWVETSPRGGAAFHVSLPVVES